MVSCMVWDHMAQVRFLPLRPRTLLDIDMTSLDLNKTISAVDLLNALSPERIFALANVCEDRLYGNRHGSRDADQTIIANTIRVALMEAVSNVVKK